VKLLYHLVPVLNGDAKDGKRAGQAMPGDVVAGGGESAAGGSHGGAGGVAARPRAHLRVHHSLPHRPLPPLHLRAALPADGSTLRRSGRLPVWHRCLLQLPKWHKKVY